MPWGWFAYPNDQSVRVSAELLATELRKVQRQFPDVQIALVTHSMGGLVARAVIEDQSLDPGNVCQLIMVAPPSHGSILAHLSGGGDLWEHWVGRGRGSPWRRYRDSVLDGRGEAGKELRPGSQLLRQLNARPRNPAVAYTILLGVGGGAETRHYDWVRREATATLKRLRAKQSAEAVGALLAELAETLGPGGDGVVSRKRAHLHGVEDTVELSFDHLGVLKDPDNNATRQARAIILQRVSA
ncbi:MAG: hypothetical protein AAGJ46_10055 [Planctomycetota bacterium]